ncbi:MAG TPA: response regulator [Candidatus Limnocylindrales bacterium]|nr:response regulator [Candidatus Limnocylindrales bacterium]
MGGDPPHGGASRADAPGTARSLAVLVVDDEVGVRDLMAQVLGRAGHDVATAASGREALRLIAGGQARPSVLVTDIEMPEMTGIELAARVLALRPAIRIVMMTASPERAETARGHPSIVDRVLLKPTSDAELLDAVQPASGRAVVR